MERRVGVKDINRCTWVSLVRLTVAVSNESDQSDEIQLTCVLVNCHGFCGSRFVESEQLNLFHLLRGSWRSENGKAMR